MSSFPHRRLAHRSCRAFAEAMERRLMFAATPVDLTGSLSPLSYNQSPSPLAAPTVSAAPSPLDVPEFSSRPSAYAKIYLDFDGQPATDWGGTAVPATPAYTVDSDDTTFSAQELVYIEQIWMRVAEKFSPFNVDVTTIRPTNFNNKHAVQVVIGGDGTWRPGAGGVAYLDSFSNSAPNTCWVFSAQAPTQLQFIADGAAHEVGHTLGLEHQSEWSGNTLVQEYSDGDPTTTGTTINFSTATAPIMGVSYYTIRGLWSDGRNSSGVLQDDMAVIARSTNGFGYRVDDYGNSLATASVLSPSGTSISATGVIEKTSDADYFSFVASAGSVTFFLTNATYGGMLDPVLELRDASDTLLASSDAGLTEFVSFTLPSTGLYYIVVKSHGSYGDVGQYDLSGTIVTEPTLIANANGPYSVSENGSVQFSAAGSVGVIAKYEWDLNYDGVTFRPSGLTGATVTRPGSDFDGPATRTVAVRISGYTGNTSVATALLTVVNIPPTATLSPVTVLEGSTNATIAFTNATDPSPADAAALRYSFDFDNDGTFDVIDSASPTALIPASIVADGPASFVVKGRVSDKDGGYTEYTATVTVTNIAPTLISPAAANAHVVLGTGYTLSLAAQDPGADTISSWTVNWGDGRTSHASSPTAVLNHDYDAVGTFAVTVTADDEDGTGYTLNRSVDVTSDPPTVSVTGGTFTPDAATFQFTLVYDDDLGIRPETLGDSDISLIGPFGPAQSIRLVSTTPTEDGRGIIATYEATGPIGDWSWQDDGIYTVSVNDHEIVDFQGDFLAAGPIGSFNIDLAAPAAPDLVASYTESLKLLTKKGKKSTASVKIYNRGSRNLPESKVTTTLYLSSDPVWDPSDKLLASSTQTFGLIINASKTIAFSFPSPKLPPNYYLVARTDTRSAVFERNERNNTTPSDKLTPSGRRADLSTSLTKKTKSSYKSGESLATSLLLTNLGDITASGPVGVKLFLSSDSILDDSDILLLSKTVDARIKGKSSVLFNLSAKIPSDAAGREWHLLAVADPSSVGDQNASNDVAVSHLFDVN